MKECGKFMFDIENPNENCIKCNCKFLTKESLMDASGKSHNYYKCTLTPKERFEKCNLFLISLEKLDIPIDLMKRVEYLNEKYLKVQGELNNEQSRVTYLEKKNDKLNREVEFYKRKNGKCNSFIDSLKERMKSENALCKDGEYHRILVNDIMEMLDKW